MDPKIKEPIVSKENQMEMMQGFQKQIKQLESKYFGFDQYCGAYDMLKNCFLCYESFFDSSEKRCKPVSKKIENCLFYIDNSTCSGCDFGYFLDHSLNKCIPNSVPNCKVEEMGICKVNPKLF